MTEKPWTDRSCRDADAHQRFSVIFNKSAHLTLDCFLYLPEDDKSYCDGEARGWAEHVLLHSGIVGFKTQAPALMQARIFREEDSTRLDLVLNKYAAAGLRIYTLNEMKLPPHAIVNEESRLAEFFEEAIEAELPLPLPADDPTPLIEVYALHQPKFDWE